MSIKSNILLKESANSDGQQNKQLPLILNY